MGPQIHRDVVTLARECSECNTGGKIMKTLNPQTSFWRLSMIERGNDENGLDFAGPFQATHS